MHGVRDMNDGVTMNRIGIGLLSGAVAAGTVLAAAPSAALAATATANAGTCPKGQVCVWSGRNATGTRCHWTGNDPDWRGGRVRCKPYGFRVNSVWNNGRTGELVTFYRNANYRGQITDPLPVTAKPVNAANLAIRSHRWTR